MTDHSVPRIGRFAPSPTGPLHIGSLIGAVASYVDARARHGQWLLRIEDIDPPREVIGASDAIQHCLRAHSLDWDGEILWQSQRYHAYQQALEQLLDQGNAFYCTCTRSSLLANKGIYPGHCRGCRSTPQQSYTVRVAVSNQLIAFEDAIQGRYQQQLQSDVGDFVILRRDKFFAYQLAVVVDDAFQGITHIVRGSDLVDSTPRQIYLQQLLGLATPDYAHFPVINNVEGQKLSKQTHARAVDPQRAVDNLLYALRFLRQPLPGSAQARHPQDILEYAIEHWQIQAIPGCLAMVELPNGSFASSTMTQ